MTVTVEMAPFISRIEEILHEHFSIGFPTARAIAIAILEMEEMEEIRRFIQLYTDMGNRWNETVSLSNVVQLWVVAEKEKEL